MITNNPKVHVYFNAGDIVQLKQDVPHKPKMIVLKINRIRPSEKPTDKPILLGVACYWFTTEGMYQERIFSSKDLEKL